jgi:hypothetical protein
MKIRPLLVTAAAGVVAAMVVPSFAHAWRPSAASGAEPRLALAASREATTQQDTPEGTRRLAPSAGQSTPLPRGGGSGSAGVPQESAPQALDEPVRRGVAPEPAPLDLAELFREPDLDLRERHFESILARAAHDAAVRSELEELAAGTDPELAWTARLALREVRATPRSMVRGPARDRALDPFWQFESIFGANPFDDPFFTNPFGGFGRSPFAPQQPDGTDPGADPFERMRSGLRRLEELVGPPQNDWLAPGTAPTPRSGVHFQGRSESLSVTPDGVRLDVEEDGPNGKTSRTYEARTLEELYSSHPELRPGKR